MIIYFNNVLHMQLFGTYTLICWREETRESPRAFVPTQCFTILLCKLNLGIGLLKTDNHHLPCLFAFKKLVSANTGFSHSPLFSCTAAFPLPGCFRDMQNSQEFSLFSILPARVYRALCSTTCQYSWQGSQECKQEDSEFGSQLALRPKQEKKIYLKK